MKYIIIGNSAAAVGCIEGIRRQDADSPVTVISAERYHTYSRPLISYLLAGKTTERKMKYRPESFYSDNRCKLIAGKTVISIQPDKKTVTLSDGKSLDYDKLLVATGSTPFVPPIAGLDSVTRKTTFLSLDDAKGLEQSIAKDCRVLILGAGLIGLKCAEGINKRVQSVTVVDMADRILPSILDQAGAAMVKSHMEKKGIQFLLSDSVQEFRGDLAILKSGKKIPFDLLVIAVGVRSNTALVANAGGEVGRGIAVNDRCETSLPDVYAAGDCTECKEVTSGERRVLALLPNAYMQGECAGVNMAGGSAHYDKAIAMNAIGFFGLHILTAGSYEGEDYITKSAGVYKRLFCKDNRLCGYILIGDVARAGIYTQMIKDRTPLDTVDFELIKEKPQLMAFSRARRKEMLGGESA
ncbi:NAD(P)/FAD-dependent oxidoreductase [Clostridiaceae bacterium NSJ-31]|uniref:NAD(P)/FAD-dependent oxidoreductase n=1 Tax=Ligaoa zhengdingensis TaxID=2763658 RepID=A0A926DW16_9FIRM|nr:FAD-dependent oxidoreductase [Ligaoa zhengdingensis]MBC8545776.1 NAD(P)/FAD-dependent oxidoreductase [Ligaoa zhengdingensis]